MSTKLWPVLSLSTLLLACAHNRANERGEARAEAREEVREERREARDERREERDERRADRDERDRDGPRAERRERAGERDMDMPRRRHKGQMASAGDELPEDSDHEADNTGVNERDRDGANPTPMDQGNGEIDLDLTQRIRKAVMADDSLSFTAKNVKIITRDGQVVLRGPVKSAAEKEAIFRAATQEAGVGRVTNQLEVDQD